MHRTSVNPDKYAWTRAARKENSMRSLSKLGVVFTGILAALALSGAARAGIITSVTASGDPTLASGESLLPDGSAWLSVGATASAGRSYDVLGTVEGDPTLGIDEFIINNTGVAWDQYV